MKIQAIAQLILYKVYHAVLEPLGHIFCYVGRDTILLEDADFGKPEQGVTQAAPDSNVV